MGTMSTEIKKFTVEHKELGTLYFEQQGDRCRVDPDHFDNFGEHYRNAWCRLRESSVGRYFNNRYYNPNGSSPIRIYVERYD